MPLRWLTAAVHLVALVTFATTTSATETERLETEAATETSVSDPNLTTAPALNDSRVEEMIVYGFQTGRLPEIPGASTQTLFPDDFIGENKSLSDLLSDTEGVSVRRFGGAGDRSEISIRGSAPSQVIVTLDGVRTNSILTGGLNLSRVCLPLVEQIKITRGAGTIEAGGGAIGGVVDIITRDAAEVGTRTAFSVGDYETYEGSLMHSGVTKDFDYSLGYCGFTTQGDFNFQRPVTITNGVPSIPDPDHAERVNNDREQHTGTLAIGTKALGGSLRFSNYATYSSGGEPGVDSSSTGTLAGQSDTARSRDLSNLAQLRWHRTNKEAFLDDIQLMLYHRYESSNYRDSIAIPIALDLNTRLSTPGLQIGLRHNSSAFGQLNELSLRVDAAHDILRANNQSGRERPRAGIALRDTLKLLSERVQFSVGARLDWTDGFQTKLLPAVGIVLQPQPWLRLRAHAGRAYRAPNFDELFHPDEDFIRGNPSLNSEDAWNFDVGVEFAFAKLGPFTNLVLRSSWFFREIDESIVYALINAETIQPINTGAATSEGVEIAVSLDFTRYSRLSANFTTTDSHRKRTGTKIPGQSSHEAFAKLRIGPKDVWKLNLEVSFVGEILIGAADSRTISNRTVFDLSASLDLAQFPRLGFDRWFDELWVFVEGNNLSDQAVRDSRSFPQPGRRFTSGIEVSW